MLLLLSYVWSAHVNELANTKHETSSTFQTGLVKGRFFTETETVGYQDITRFGMAHYEVIFIHCSSKKDFFLSIDVNEKSKIVILKNNVKTNTKLCRYSL